AEFPGLRIGRLYASALQRTAVSSHHAACHHLPRLFYRWRGRNVAFALAAGGLLPAQRLQGFDLPGGQSDLHRRRRTACHRRAYEQLRPTGRHRADLSLQLSLKLPSPGPRPEERPTSAFTRVFDALWARLEGGLAIEPHHDAGVAGFRRWRERFADHKAA